jgi:site-specific recombinase XerD
LGAGYSSSSAATHLWLMARLSDWLESEECDLSSLSEERLWEFLVEHRRHGHRFPKSARGAGPLVGFLRGLGVIPGASSPERDRTEMLLDRFGSHLRSERGLAPGTIIGQVHAGRLFLRSLDDRPLGSLEPSCVHAFIAAESGRRSVSSTKGIVTGLRSLFRFFDLEGMTEASLVGAVPTVSGWTGTWIPKAAKSQDVRRVIEGCDRSNGQGKRDFAVLMVLSRLGLRVGEVAALNVGDIDWRNGQIVVRGKASRVERLPLPHDVGSALADYLQHGRPSCDDRAMFVRLLAPHRRLTTGGLIMVVKSACTRAGVAPIAAHRLRHTVATELLGAGAGLSEIGQLLRHRNPASTAIYAKVDVDALRELARPWPGARA